jgi:uncharacterized tellurite resistance protein B-like protein
MATLVPRAKHPALDLGEGDRTDYLIVVASTAWADRQVSDEELARLQRMSEALDLPAAAAEGVIEATRNAAARPDAARIDALLARLATRELRYAMLVDAIDIAYADDTLLDEEAARLEVLAERLEIPPVQRELVRRYVASKRSGSNGGNGSAAWLASALVGLGVPLATIAVATAAGVALPVAAAVGVVLGAAGFVVLRRVLIVRSKNAAAAERRG